MQPYFYKIRHKPSGKYYVGVQYGKNANPNNFWISYFTSSKYIKQMINEDGAESFEIIKIIIRSDARDYEFKYLNRVYRIFGKQKFLEWFINRNLSPGIVLSQEEITKINGPKKRESCSKAAKKLFEENRHNFQLFPAHEYESVIEDRSERMKGNTIGSLRVIDDDLRNKLSSGSTGNTNVVGYKWWYNPKTKVKIRAKDSPGDDWVNKCPANLSADGARRISEAVSKPRSKETIEKMRIAAKNRPSNSKGTIWVVNDVGKRKRVKPENVPEGFKPVKEAK